MSDPYGPLAGVKVLEIAHYIAGPYAAAILGDQGADVVKIEPPGGEPGRRALPLAYDGESLYYAAYNRNKRSITLDLTSEPARPVLNRLIRWADVVITNLSFGVPEKLGFGWQRVSELNPRVVMVHITGFGSWSKLRDYVCYDSIGQAMGGLAGLTGDADGPPRLSSVFICDHATAVQAALAASTGLHFRERTGTGTFVDVSMQRAMVNMLGAFVPEVDLVGDVPHRTGNRSPKTFTNVFPASDGFVVISPNTPKMWQALCEEIGRPEWGDEEIALSRRHILNDEFRRVIDRAIADWTGALRGDDVMQRLQSRGVPCGVVRTIDGLCHDDRELDLGTLEAITLANGAVTRVVGPAFTCGRDERGGNLRIAHNRISAIGADEASVLSEIGLMREDGATRTAS